MPAACGRSAQRAPAARATAAASQRRLRRAQGTVTNDRDINGKVRACVPIYP